MLETTRRFLSIAALALWLGGIVFYGDIVVPTAHEVLGSHREIGFVTRKVTGPLNGMGVVSLALLLWSTVSESPSRTRLNRIALWVTWGVMAASLVTLFALRSWLDGLLDPTRMEVADRQKFFPLHERYLNVTSILCLAGLAHLWALSSGFQRGSAGRPP
jgi:hypothetical protein